jgi:ribulose-5-phosphate 4-epimerase/fuculose-1-phosphate aldolase
LIHNDVLGDDVADSLGDRPVVLMRGHGLTSTGTSVQEAVLRAISVDVIASLSLSIVSAGGTLKPIGADDLADLPNLGAGLNVGAAWRHEVSRLD